MRTAGTQPLNGERVIVSCSLLRTACSRGSGFLLVSHWKGISMVNIRRATLADLDDITDIYNEAILTTTAAFDIEPRTRADRQAWFDAHDARHPILVAELEQKVVGWASLTRWNPRAAYADTAETSMYVQAEHRGKGIGRQLKQAIIEEAKRLGFHTLIAGVAEGSDASLHLNKSFGFELVGTFKEVGRKFGELLDVTYLQLMLK